MTKNWSQLLAQRMSREMSTRNRIGRQNEVYVVLKPAFGYRIISAVVNLYSIWSWVAKVRVTFWLRTIARHDNLTEEERLSREAVERDREERHAKSMQKTKLNIAPLLPLGTINVSHFWLSSVKRGTLWANS